LFGVAFLIVQILGRNWDLEKKPGGKAGKPPPMPPTTKTEVKGKQVKGKDRPKEKPKGELKPVEDGAPAKVPASSSGPEPPKPTVEIKSSKSKFRSGKKRLVNMNSKKVKCDHECSGDGRQCRHITIYPSWFGTRIGTCEGINCAGYSTLCGPCYKKCPDIATKPKCDYDCDLGDNQCKHTTTYPDLREQWGFCAGTNCNGVTDECGTCQEKCPNIKTDTECDVECKNEYSCTHKTTFNDGGYKWGGCHFWGWGSIKFDCNGVTDECEPCYKTCNLDADDDDGDLEY